MHGAGEGLRTPHRCFDDWTPRRRAGTGLRLDLRLAETRLRYALRGLISAEDDGVRCSRSARPHALADAVHRSRYKVLADGERRYGHRPCTRWGPSR